MDSNNPAISCFNKISERFYGFVDSMTSKFHSFLIRRIHNRFRPREYVLATYFSENCRGDSIHIDPASLKGAYNVARRDLKRCNNLPKCFAVWEGLELFEGGDRSYVFFDRDEDSGELMGLHATATHERQNEKISALLRRLNLPFFITRDLIVS